MIDRSIVITVVAVVTIWARLEGVRAFGVHPPAAVLLLARQSPQQHAAQKCVAAAPLRMSTKEDDVVNEAIAAMYGGTPPPESPAETRARIQALVDANKVLLFMKGSKSFPQCGFSDTATKILAQLCGSGGADFATVDVLSDPAIRQGIKEFSQWPTIPQLYVDREFIGGSDIMLEMYQSGELKELIEKATSSE